jgi:superfamily II DNA or RNA helicase
MFKPCLENDTLVTRSYQEEALDATRGEYRKHIRRTLILHPTGLGKTVLAAKASRLTLEKGGRVLFVAHTSELIEQAADKFERCGILASIEKAGQHARSLYDPDCVIGSVQTLRNDRLESWPKDYFNLLIYDEVHHSVAPKNAEILRHFDRARVLGITATPDRADEEMLATIFESVAHEMTIWDAMTAPPPGPWLSRLVFTQCDVGIDLRGLRKGEDDFSLSDLESRIAPMVGTLANAIRQEIEDRQTLVFTPQVASSQAMASALASLGFRADWVSGDDPERSTKIKRFKEGDSQILVSCALLTEGFDCPSVSAIVLCRPTQSRAVFSQMIGRGTRLYPGKDCCIVIDFDFLTQRMSLVRPADLFDGMTADPAFFEIAGEILQRPGRHDILEVVEQAREEHERREILRIRTRERQVQYHRRITYDPLAMAETLGVPMRGAVEARFDPPTEAQCNFARKLKIDNPESMSRRRLSRLIEVVKARIAAKLATARQIDALVAHGVAPAVARKMSLETASAKLDELIGNKRSRIVVPKFSLES